MKKSLLMLCATLLVATAAHAAPSTFDLLSKTDGAPKDCGTFVHDKGVEPDAGLLRAFMSTEKFLYLRTGSRLKVLELVKVEQQMRDKDILGRGDVVTLHFKNSNKESAKMVGLVTEAVIDDDGGYPVIAMDLELSFTSASGKTSRESGLIAHDMCL